MSATLRIHAIEPRSRANGPGVRYALWVQGCTLACPGCFNPDTHALAPGRDRSIDELVADIAAQGDGIEGVTISGGEPFEQPAGLLALVRAIRRTSQLSILVFSGYRRQELEQQSLGPAILASIDVLIDGRYQAGERLGHGLRGSGNQAAHFLTDRYQRTDLDRTPVGEVLIGPDGTVRISGVAPLPLRGKRLRPGGD